MTTTNTGTHMSQPTSPWFEAERIALTKYESTRAGTGLAKEWGYQQQLATQEQFLAEAITVARNFARLVGVPADTVIRLASIEQIGTGCAGFYDAPKSFRRPFICVDANEVFQRVDNDSTVGMETVIGLALHEAMHILQSRDIYRRMVDNRNAALTAMENLLEDHRIEQILLEQNPSLGRYIYKTREVLIFRQWVEHSVENWSELNAERKVMTVVGAYIRAPNLLARHTCLREWTKDDGKNVFAELCRLVPNPPLTEQDVAEQARILMNEILGKDPSPDPNEPLFSFEMTEQADLSQILEKLKRRILQRKDITDDDTTTSDHPDRRPIGEMTFDEAAMSDSRVRTGATRVMIDMIEQLVSGTERTSTDTASVGGSLPKTAQHLPGYVRGRVQIEVPASDASGKLAYEQSKTRVRHLTSHLRDLFPIPTTNRKRKTQQRTGNLDSRRLYQAAYSSQVFAVRGRPAPRGRTLIALLLDASSSMNWGIRHRYALDTAVLLNESLAHHNNTQVYTYSHSTREEGVCVLYPHGRAGEAATAARLGNYRTRSANYDYAAIWGVVSCLAREAEGAERRFLFVVSDGQPCTPLGQI
ncbi:MAG: VWA domain-containing protein, partial [Planctomycetales bacterium]|nr:VWA domain-containing protein [Planctomycetales bacterium]